MLRREYSSLFDTSISTKPDQKHEKDQRSGTTSEKLKPGSHQGFLHHYCKNLEIFLIYIFFFISNRKLNIVKVLNKTQISDKVEAT